MRDREWHNERGALNEASDVIGISYLIKRSSKKVEVLARIVADDFNESTLDAFPQHKYRL